MCCIPNQAYSKPFLTHPCPSFSSLFNANNGNQCVIISAGFLRPYLSYIIHGNNIVAIWNCNKCMLASFALLSKILLMFVLNNILVMKRAFFTEIIGQPQKHLHENFKCLQNFMTTSNTNLYLSNTGNKCIINQFHVET